jgi:hypothetical protein
LVGGQNRYFLDENVFLVDESIDQFY